ncbi:reverse transcriptase domain-containing protein [Tanacetum coccineum]
MNSGYKKRVFSDTWLTAMIFTLTLVDKPLTSLTQKIRKYEWVKEQEEAFQTLKDNICDTPILSLPDESKEFVVYCDTLNQGLGCVLMQRGKVENATAEMLCGLDQLLERKEGEEKDIATYVSNCLTHLKVNAGTSKTFEFIVTTRDTRVEVGYNNYGLYYKKALRTRLKHAYNLSSSNGQTKVFKQNESLYRMQSFQRRRLMDRRRCPIFNGFDLGGVHVNTLAVNHVPEKLYLRNPKFTLGEFSIQFLFLKQFQNFLESSSCSSCSPLENPERTIRRTRVDPNPFEEINMAANRAGPPPAGGDGLPVPDLRTMEELCQPTLNGRGGPIAPIAIQATNFRLKNDMIQQVQNSCPFRRLGDDANKHLDKFLHVTQSMKVNGNSITTFDQMAKIFLGKYFPPSMVTKLRNDIMNFHQEPDGSLFEAWERYKLYIDRCPNHNMLPVTQIDTFYNGLTMRHRDTINAAAGALKLEMAEINKNLMKML